MGNFLKIENVVKTYKLQNGENFNAISGVSLNIDKGDIYGIMGLSGAGKSTLIRLINRLEEPTDGKILISKDNSDDSDNTFENILDYNEKELREYRKKTGMIFQHFNLLNSRNVFKNVAFPLEIAGWKKSEISKRVDELLEIVGLSDKKNHYPEQLSGGQKQRVAIARALANNPKVLLSDEATSALDPKTTNSILDLLRDINKKFGITIILITHQMEVIRKICNKTAIISQGKVIEEGLTKDIFANPKSDIAKEFVSNLTHSKDTLKETIETSNFAGNRTIKLTFTGNQVEKAYIAELIKKFDIVVNILGGSIDRLRDGLVGHLIVSIEADDEKYLNISNWLKENNVEIEEV